jgi:hypothetical protein
LHFLRGERPQEGQRIFISMHKKYDPEHGLTVPSRVAEFEELMLLAIAGLEKSAYGIAIQQRCYSAAITGGQTQCCNQRAVWSSATLAKQGSNLCFSAQRTHGKARWPLEDLLRAKIYYELTRAGQGALTAAEEVRFRLRSLTTHTVLLRSQL